MNKVLLITVTLLTLFSACKKDVSKAKTIPLPTKTVEITPDVTLIPLGEGLYKHVTLYDFPGFGTFPSNGLLFIKNGKAFLVDTPPNNKLTEILYSYLKDSLDVTITKAVVCHSHDDCLGGLSFLQTKNVSSVALDKTKDICIKRSLPIPSETFSDSLSFQFEGEQIHCGYFGGGHTVDNITVYFLGLKVLFGGCLIKAANSSSLGNTKEADIRHWDVTIKNLQKRYVDVAVVVPGHGEHGGKELLDHSISLVEKYKKNK